jgi:hypothetical protein
MLIIAIPKSSSTSLMKTLAKLHRKDYEQNMFPHYEKPEACRWLHHFHEDIRKMPCNSLLEYVKSQNIYKQHIFPNDEHMQCLKTVKKIVLLREVKEIVLAYRRLLLLHPEGTIKGFPGLLSEEEWISHSKEIGLYQDLDTFYNKWLQADKKYTWIVHFKDLIHNTKAEINKIEKFLDLPVTHKNIVLKKERYTHHSPWRNFFDKKIYGPVIRKLSQWGLITHHPHGIRKKDS